MSSERRVASPEAGVAHRAAGITCWFAGESSRGAGTLRKGARPFPTRRNPARSLVASASSRVATAQSRSPARASLAGEFVEARDHLLAHLNVWTVLGWRALLGSASITVVGVIEWRGGSSATRSPSALRWSRCSRPSPSRPTPPRPLHLVVRETEFCGLRLAGDFRRRTRENGRNSVRRPRHAALWTEIARVFVY